MTRRFPLFMLLLVGCGGGDVNAVGATVADEIRIVDSSLIARVVFTPADMVDDAAIDVILRQGATRKEALSVVCDIVSPLIAAANPPRPMAVGAYGRMGSAFSGTALPIVLNGPRRSGPTSRTRTTEHRAGRCQA